MSLPLGAGPEALQHLEAAWRARFGPVEGLELLNIIDRGGFATVFKGGWELLLHWDRPLL